MSDYSSQALSLLNFAEMHIDSRGKKVTYEQRLADIEDQYGINSWQYENALALMGQLKKSNYGF